MPQKDKDEDEIDVEAEMDDGLEDESPGEGPVH
jgi:hypothetical protein